MAPQNLWRQNKLLITLSSISLFLITLYLAYLLLPLLGAVTTFFAQVAYPFILSFILYYLLRPVVRHLRAKVGVYLAIGAVYLIITLFLLFLIIWLYPIIYEQFNSLQTIDLSHIFDEKQGLAFLSKIPISEELGSTAKTLFGTIHSAVIGGVEEFFSIVGQFFLMVVITPFVLFYLFKDDHELYENFISLLPERIYEFTLKLMKTFDEVMLHFFTGRVLISLSVNIFLFVCFYFIGLNYYVLLTLISFILYIIPSIGSMIATILPTVVGFSMSTTIGLEVLLVVGIGTWLEGFLFTPQIMKSKLYIHPIVVIIILLSSDLLFGVLGVLFSTPLYVLVRAFVKQSYQSFISYYYSDV